MRKRGCQTSQATTATDGRRRSNVKRDCLKSPRKRVAARMCGEHTDSHMLSSKGRNADVGTNNPEVTDNFSYRMPVSTRELDAIERYLGVEIDQLLRHCK